MESIKILSLKNEEVTPWLLQKHYAQRIPSISFAYGLFAPDLVGVVTYGTPSSSSLRLGICGDQWKNNVLELNRLVCNEGKNYASFLVANSLQHLPKPTIVVSYADMAMGHVGYIYQATNFLYTGLSAKRKDYRIRGMENLHQQTINDMARGQENRVSWLKAKFGDDFYMVERSRKHRYIFFCGNKYQKRQMLNDLKYKLEPYPKGQTKRYDAGNIVSTQQLLF
jgi:hypothetical protein